jgi:hypothetical protein|nr:MAG TPA: hypothetical protein [Caudoviricetes sp.]
MLVYTTDESIKDKLLDNKQVLKKQKEVNGEMIYVFFINDMSLLNRNFSKEENSKIILVNNKFTF